MRYGVWNPNAANTLLENTESYVEIMNVIKTKGRTFTKFKRQRGYLPEGRISWTFLT